MDTEPTTIPVPSPPRRGTSAVVAVAALLVALAVLKPWEFGAPTAAGPPVAGPPASSLAVAPEPTAVPALLVSDPDAMACMSSEGDRVLALQRSSGTEVRTWLTLADPSLADPLDPSVVPLRLPSSHVIGLGVCARRVVDSAALASAAQLLRVEAVSGGATPGLTNLGLPGVITQQPGSPTLGVLYGPPPALGPSTAPKRSPGPDASPAVEDWATWPPGAYALAFRFPGDPSTLIRWLRLDIVAANGKYG